jgi:hypothetical protein
MISIRPSDIKSIDSGFGIDVEQVGEPKYILSNIGAIDIVGGTDIEVDSVGGKYTINCTAAEYAAPIQTIIPLSGVQVINANGPITEIINTGVLNIQNGENTEVEEISSTTQKINSKLIDAVNEGNGITVTGSQFLIDNSGVLSLTNGNYTTIENMGNGVWKTNAQVVSSVSEGSGISVVTLPNQGLQVSNNGVIELIPGNNTSPVNLGNGLWKVDCTETLISTVAAGDGIAVSNTTISNTGVISFANGTNTTAVNTGNGIWKINASLNSTLKTYTEAYSGNGSWYVPQNCQYLDIVIISKGGNGGTGLIFSGNPNYDGYYSGGSGGGGTTCSINQVPTFYNQVYRIKLTTAGIELYYSVEPTPSGQTPSNAEAAVAKVPNGKDGTDAFIVLGVPYPGDSGNPGDDPFTASQFGSWTVIKGSYGQDGNKGGTFPQRGGYPTRRPYVAGEVGCGAISDAANPGEGVVYMTYYLL